MISLDCLLNNACLYLSAEDETTTPKKTTHGLSVQHGRKFSKPPPTAVGQHLGEYKKSLCLTWVCASWGGDEIVQRYIVVLVYSAGPIIHHHVLYGLPSPMWGGSVSDWVIIFQQQALLSLRPVFLSCSCVCNGKQKREYCTYVYGRI